MAEKKEKSTVTKTAVEKKETKATAKQEKAVKPAPEKKVVKPAPKAAKPAKAEDNSPDMVYHISKRKEDRKWQVKAQGAAKALKLFWTQEEAIDYAKSVAGNQEGRIVIHKEDGSFRKLKY